MSIAGVHHVSFAVTDLDRSIEFYQTVLGFRLRSKGVNKGADLGRALFGTAHWKAGEECEEQVAEMEFHGMVIEFVTYVKPPTKPYHRDRAVAGPGHLALRVKNISEELKRLESLGVEFLSPVAEFNPPGKGPYKWVDFRDPDGIIVELVEELPTDAHLTLIADRIKDARLSRGLTLQEVASKGNFSAAHLSQIERGQATPSLPALLSISHALGVPPDYFLRPGDSLEKSGDTRPEPLVEANDGAMHGLQAPPTRARQALETLRIAGGAEWTTLTNGDAPVQFIERYYGVGAHNDELFSQATGLEIGVVLQGTLLVEEGFSKHVLGPGSSISYDRCVPHRVSNVGDVPVVTIWAILEGNS